METIFRTDTTIREVLYYIDVQYHAPSNYVRIEVSHTDDGFIIEYTTKKAKEDLVKIFNNIMSSIRSGLVTDRNLRSNIEAMFSTDDSIDRHGGVQTVRIDKSTMNPDLVFLALLDSTLAGLQQKLTRYNLYDAYVIENMIYVSGDGGSSYFIIGRLGDGVVTLQDRFFGKVINVGRVGTLAIDKIRVYLEETKAMLGSIPPLIMPMLIGKWGEELSPLQTKGETSEESEWYQDNFELVRKIREASK